MLRSSFHPSRVVALAIALLSLAAAAKADRLIVMLTAEAAKSALTPKAQIERLGAAAGAPLSYVRPMAVGAHVVAMEGMRSRADAERAAARLATDPAVEFAEVDELRQPAAFPDDQYLTAQHYLPNDPAAISAFSAWEVTFGSSATVVAVVDSGYRPHRDLTGRILPGYDMISSAAIANDGDGRDVDATDPGDFLLPAELTGTFATCSIRYGSSWHGTGVAGIIAANANNGVWTAGIDWNARILPVRVLGKCGGYDSDIVDGVAWAAGLAVPGVPANATPAGVINLSLGGSGPCRASYRTVFAAALAHGVTRAIVVAAGNSAVDVANDTPASCADAIAVASTTSSGRLARYSNFGAGIAVSAPGGTINFNIPDEGIFVLSNSGQTTPNEPSPFGDSIKSSGGTSFAAPMVTGTISLMLAVAPYLTPAQVREIVTGTAKPFPAGSDCVPGRCGAGIVDAGAAVRAAAAVTPPPALTASVTVVEYYNAALDHYFITHVANEIALLDAGVTIKGWVRTGETFRVYAAASPGSSPVCRFYIPPAKGDSHFYGRGTAECSATAASNPTFVNEDPQFFHVALPTAGACPPSMREVYRAFSNRPDANHRYMVDRTIRDAMAAQGWLTEGDGPNLVVMCAPQ
ncbi:MAG: S8 family peptidase [Casimicrobiaceae bacterium]